MYHIKQSIAWWCFTQQEDMTMEKMVRIAADIGYEAIELAEQEHWQCIKDHAYFGHYHTAGNPGRHELDESQELQYRPIIQTIATTGYTGYLGQEFIPTGDPEVALRQAFEVCNARPGFYQQRELQGEDDVN
jgi:sugar phosphate isomerase/epimerase